MNNIAKNGMLEHVSVKPQISTDDIEQEMDSSCNSLGDPICTNKNIKDTSKLSILNRTIERMCSLYKEHIDKSTKDDDVFILGVHSTGSLLKYIEDYNFKTKTIINDNFLETLYSSGADRFKVQLEKQKIGLWYKETCIGTYAFDINGIKGIFDMTIGIDIYSSDRYEHLGGYIAIHRDRVNDYLKITQDIRQHEKEIRRKNREYDQSISKSLNWNDLILDTNTKEEIITNIESFFQAKDFYKEHNLPYKRGFIFVGPPGNGKSLCINVINSVYFNNIMTFYISPETEIRTIRHYFKEEIDMCKLIVIEELDKITDTNGMLSIILDCIDGCSNKQFSNLDCGTITIATANDPENISKAFTKRPSRFDRIWKFDNPSLENKIEYFQKLSNGYYNADDLRKIFGDTELLSMAAVKEVYIDSHMKIISEKRHPTPEEICNSISSILGQYKKVDNNFKEAKKMGFVK